MTTPPNAADRRTARGGRAHLTLVTDQDDTATSADDSQPSGGRHAAPVNRIPIAGSATVRALIALGAILTAAGFTVGKADAVLHAHEQPHQEAEDSEPSVELPVTRAAAVHGFLMKVPAAAAVNAAHWASAPASRTATVASYKVPAAAGRHRKPSAAEGWGEWNPDTWGRRSTGRHRRLESAAVAQSRHRHTDTETGTGRPVFAAVDAVKTALPRLTNAVVHCPGHHPHHDHLDLIGRSES